MVHDTSQWTKNQEYFHKVPFKKLSHKDVPTVRNIPRYDDRTRWKKRLVVEKLFYFNLGPTNGRHFGK